MADLKLPSRSEDFSEWYKQLVLRAELADYAPVRGCMIVRCYGWSIWENVTEQLGRVSRCAVGRPYDSFDPKRNIPLGC